MKKSLYITYIITALVLSYMLISACTKEKLQPEIKVTVQTLPDIIAEYTQNQVDSKITTYPDGRTAWDENDELSVFVVPTGTVPVWKEHKYITNKEGFDKGHFSCNSDAPLADMNDWYIMSPYSYYQVSDPVAASSFSLDGQRQKFDDPLVGLTNFDIMTGFASNVNINDHPKTKLYHRGALMSFTLFNNTGKPLNVKRVVLKAPDGKNVGGTYGIDFKNGQLKPIRPSNRMTLAIDGEGQIDDQKEYTVYMIVAPFFLEKGESFSLSVVAAEQTYSHTFTMKRKVDFQAARKHHANFKIEAVTPKVRKIEAIWQPSGLIDRPTGIGVNDKYVYIHRYGEFANASPIYVYDYRTGNKVTALEGRSSYMLNADVDDAGHFFVSRLNVHQGSFKVDYYNHQFYPAEYMNLPWNSKIGNNGPQNPDKMGYGLNICGDVTRDVHIYATAPNSNIILQRSKRFGNSLALKSYTFNTKWQIANVQRNSNSDHYIAYNVAGNNSVFQKYDADFTNLLSEISLKPLGLILDFKVFHMDNKVYVATLEQERKNLSQAAGTAISVSDITDPSKPVKISTFYPGAIICSKFKDLTEPLGAISVFVDEIDDCAYIAASVLSNNNINSKICVCKF